MQDQFCAGKFSVMKIECKKIKSVENSVLGKLKAWKIHCKKIKCTENWMQGLLNVGNWVMQVLWVRQYP